MDNILLKVNTTKSQKLDTDESVEECMSLLKERYPNIQGYTFERLDAHHIQILIWGDLRGESTG